MAAVALLWATYVADNEPGAQLGDLVGLVAIPGLPLAVAVGLLVRKSVAVAVGRDLPERLLALATAGLRGERGTWGAAMRAELAAVDDPGERRRFAVGCGLTALRTGWSRSAVLVAAAAGGLLATAMLVSSRLSLAGDRSGPLLGVVAGLTPMVLLAVAAGAGFTRASFRCGLEHGFLALLFGLVGILAVAMPEGARWAEAAGVFLLDGDAPRMPLTARAGALDALTSTLLFGSLTWLPWPVIGAGLGVSLRRRSGRLSPGAVDVGTVFDR
jgi:hypothetical protein